MKDLEITKTKKKKNPTTNSTKSAKRGFFLARERILLNYQIKGHESLDHGREDCRKGLVASLETNPQKKEPH